MISFFVAGRPIAQGSMTAFVVGRRQADGSVAGPRAVVTASNKGMLDQWRRAVQDAAATAMVGIIMSDQPVAVCLSFVLPRGRTVTRPWPSVRPDADKLARAILDALTGVVYVDDAQVVRLDARKRYEAGASGPGVHIQVAELGEE